MTGRLLYLSACALLLAGIIHIAIILLVPAYGTRDAHARLSQSLPVTRFAPLDPEAGALPLPEADPFFRYGACRFDLSTAGVRLRGPAYDQFWSATILDTEGSVIFSLNTRTAVAEQLDVIVLDPARIARLRELAPEEVETAAVVEADVRAGFILLRAALPDESWKPRLERFLQEVSCAPYEPQERVEEPSGSAEPPEPGGSGEPAAAPGTDGAEGPVTLE